MSTVNMEELKKLKGATGKSRIKSKAKQIGVKSTFVVADSVAISSFADVKNEQGEKVLREKKEVYGEYLGLVRRSLDVPYSYDIIGHFGYLTRYAPYEDKRLTCAEFSAQIDDIFKTIIQKGKILELNTSRSNGIFLPSRELLERYYALGGRLISYGSDAHAVGSVANDREIAMAMLKEIGFTHITVPCKGEYIKVEI